MMQALAGLNPAERIELLTLLEARARQEAERPEDNRPPLSSYLEPGTAAEQAHYASLAAHMKRLQSERPLPPDADAGAYLRWHAQLFDEAGRLADADGYPAVLPKAAPDPADPPDEHPLPTATAHDVEVSRAIERAQRNTVPNEPEPDRLAPFHGSGRQDHTISVGMAAEYSSRSPTEPDRSSA